MKFSALILLVTYLALSNAAVKYGSKGNTYFSTPSKTQTRTTNYKQPAVTVSHYGGAKSADAHEEILRNESEIKEDGSYHYAYETSNGISASEHGVGGQSVEGESSYTSPEGVQIKMTYTADENGFHPVGDHIPKMPEYIARALEYIRAHPYQPKEATSGGRSSYKEQPTYKAPAKVNTYKAPAVKASSSSSFKKASTYSNRKTSVRAKKY